MCTVEDQLIKLLSNKDQAVVVNTDTVYGILSKSESTIRAVKMRESSEKKTVRLISSLDQIEGKLSEEFIKIASAFWPGPLTLIYENQGYRMPNNKLLLRAIDKSGPIYASSANITGRPTVKNISEAKLAFRNSKIKIHYLDTAEDLNTKNIPSTIFDVDNLRMIREGEISMEQIISQVQKS